MTGSQRLTAAAARLRAAAEGTYSDGLEPWRVITAASTFMVVEGQEPIARCADRGDAAYIALISPAVAVAVADWLDFEAATPLRKALDAAGHDLSGYPARVVEAIEHAEPLVAGVARG